ncbi:zinc-binding dehydrogenase [Thorsellia anophelis]|uniref:zinc-binding dehydrogenase n=1 Tax=Thorsellia anophelis TaxID=336804 RepID=UPI001FE1ABF1|nr:alcohol dehydrogenase catalytic domain-containing protein [Thorsellia anophelis]
MQENSKLVISNRKVELNADNDVLVEVNYSGVCGSDMPRIFNGGAHYYPIILGHEFSAKVIKIGKNVKNIKENDRITCAPLVPCLKCDVCEKGNYSLCSNYTFIGSRIPGSNSNILSIPESSCVKLPNKVSMLQGAFFEPITVGLHPILIAGGCKDKNVIVIGAGTIGLLTLQAAVALGALTVTVFDIDQEKLALAKKLGATHTFNSLVNSDLEKFLNLKTIASEQLIIEMAGSPSAFELVLNIAAPRAEVFLVGTLHKDLSLGYKTYEKILRKELKIQGSWMNYSKAFPGKEWDIAAELFSNNQIDIDSLIEGIFEPSSFVDRIHSLPINQATGKIILKWPNF